MTSTVNEKLDRYYQFHSQIYDLTRWSFLFGRQAVISELSRQQQDAANILEIGCGTGKNLQSLRQSFPGARITGIDASSDMLQRAAEKTDGDTNVELICGFYDRPHTPQSFDIILLSYALTMMGDNWQRVLQSCREDLRRGGIIAVVDFYSTPLAWFRRWMQVNHVDIDPEKFQFLRDNFSGELDQTSAVYGGLWQYGLFLGRKQ